MIFRGGSTRLFGVPRRWRFCGCRCEVIVNRILIIRSLACFAYGVGRKGTAGLPKTRAAVLEFRRDTCFVACGRLSEVSPPTGRTKACNGDWNEQSRRQRFQEHPLLLVLRQ